MPRTYKLVLFYGVLILGAFDAHALVGRLLGASAVPVSWLKVVWSLVAQGVLVGMAAGYLAFLAKRPGQSTWRTFSVFGFPFRVWPLAALCFLAAVAVAMLYNGLWCGESKFPAGRSGTGSICGR
jgi:hypothetical protein